MFSIKPYKNTLKNGLIIDDEKFIKSFSILLNKYNIKNSFIKDNIIVITNNLYNRKEKEYIKNILLNSNYKKVTFINELHYLKINNRSIYINYNNSYFYLYYVYNNKIKMLLYENNNINNIISVLKKLKYKNIFIYGKNYKSLKEILDNNNISYYVFEDSDNLLIKMCKDKN